MAQEEDCRSGKMLEKVPQKAVKPQVGKMLEEICHPLAVDADTDEEMEALFTQTAVTSRQVET